MKRSNLRKTFWTAAFVLSLATLPLTLVGCSGGNEGGTGTSPNPSASPSP